MCLTHIEKAACSPEAASGQASRGSPAKKRRSEDQRRSCSEAKRVASARVEDPILW
jgi:hypothetical protein